MVLMMKNFGGSLKNLTFLGVGGSQKTNIEGGFPKKGRGEGLG